jgi:Flp pilus assembly protein TadG
MNPPTVHPGLNRRAPFDATAVRGERGQALVEFALASTIFFMTLFATVEFGLGIWHYNMVSNLAQEGARWASVHGASSASPASSAAVQTYVRSRAPGMQTVTVTATPAPSTVARGLPVTVVAENYTVVSSFIPHGTFVLQSTARMIVSR